MKRILFTILAVALIIVSAVLLYAWSDLPRRTTQRFAGHLYHQRYDEAASMLRSPSALEVTPDGSLILVDRNENATPVPAAKLPFIVGGREGGPENDFKMTALGRSTNGILDTPPVTLYLSVDGSLVRIEAVENR